MPDAIDVGKRRGKTALLASCAAPAPPAQSPPQPVPGAPLTLADAERDLASWRQKVAEREEQVSVMRRKASAGTHRISPDQNVIARRAISPNELALQLGVSPASALRACRNGTVRAVRFGRRFLIPADEAERILCAGTLSAPDAA